MRGTEQAADEAEALARLARVVRSFKIERRMEDEPAHHDKVMARLAEPEERR